MALLLVVLVLTTASAIGVFAMHSASLVNRATGFHRQNVQATAITEFGIRGAATWLGPHKEEILNAVADPANPIRAPHCAPALLAADPLASCWVIPDDSLESQFKFSSVLGFSDGLDGLLSPPSDVGTSIRAELGTEVTETFNANAAALPGSSGSLLEVTFTTRARVFPIDANSATSCAAADRGAVSQQRLRSHLLLKF
ncbi:MAG: hypothetical protein RL685_5962 [Pseudomonadota bacterium]|jgi:hypothetical protein